MGDISIQLFEQCPRGLVGFDSIILEGCLILTHVHMDASTGVEIRVPIQHALLPLSVLVEKVELICSVLADAMVLFQSIQSFFDSFFFAVIPVRICNKQIVRTIYILCLPIDT
jgi:hypothetical protein